jgi:hypothetical protein
MQRIVVGKVRITKKVLDEQLREALVGGRRGLRQHKGREKALALGKEVIVDGHLEGKTKETEVRRDEDPHSPSFFQECAVKYFST